MSQTSIRSQSERTILTKNNSSAKPKYTWIVDFIKVIFLANVLVKGCGFISNKLSVLVTSAFKKETQTNKHPQFNQRSYEKSVQQLKLDQKQLGFTNQILYQQTSKTITFYLPVYITCKIKSVQEVSVQSLSGNVSCALIINVGYGELPDEIVKKLQTSIIVQLNRGQALKLQDDGVSITTKNDKKVNFLIFTIRKVFTAFLVEDTLWSPFQLIELIISLTLNTVTVTVGQFKKGNPLQNEKATGYDPKKQYKISFNCMRNSDKIPISFALDCVFGVYDLAQNRLESYHTQLGSYSEIVRAHQTKRENKLLKRDEEKKKEDKKNGQPLPYINQFTKLLLQYSTNLVMRKNNLGSSKPPKKVKYFQYTHFVIPLYKYPGNSLATIFIPIFLLALVSLAIFFQGPQLAGRVGSIATMILGYIALIPSIKQQLPPSSKITVVETVVYIETMCCLLCLYESFRTSSIHIDDFIFIWYQNIMFMICLITHFLTFLFVIGLFAFHKLRWQPEYNCDQKVIQIKPADNIVGWDNPYCDKVFAQFNKEVLANNQLTEKQKQSMEVKIYVNPFKKGDKKDDNKKRNNKQQKKEIEKIAKNQVSSTEKNEPYKKEKNPFEILITDFPSSNEFVYDPNLELYESIKINSAMNKND